MDRTHYVSKGTDFDFEAILQESLRNFKHENYHQKMALGIYIAIYYTKVLITVYST